MPADAAHERLQIGQLALRFLIDGPASGFSVTVFEMEVPSGAKLRDAFHESIYGLQRVLSMTSAAIAA